MSKEAKIIPLSGQHLNHPNEEEYQTDFPKTIWGASGLDLKRRFYEGELLLGDLLDVTYLVTEKGLPTAKAKRLNYFGSCIDNSDSSIFLELFLETKKGKTEIKGRLIELSRIIHWQRVGTPRENMVKTLAEIAENLPRVSRPVSLA